MPASEFGTARRTNRYEVNEMIASKIKPIPKYLLEKIRKNAAKYPVEKAKGSAKKYNEL